MNHKWIEASQEVVPAVIDYAIERYEEFPSIDMFTEMNKELVKDEGVLLFIELTWMKIDPEGFREAIEKYGW